MGAINEQLSRAVEQLLGRASGPLHFRLVMQPVIATILAIRAGLKDAREGQPPFLWAFLTNPAERKRLAASGWKDIGKVFVIAIVLDIVYQAIVLRGFFVLQTLIVTTVVALLPYVLFRGLATQLARGRHEH
jgi:hypothetical protein